MVTPPEVDNPTPTEPVMKPNKNEVKDVLVQVSLSDGNLQHVTTLEQDLIHKTTLCEALKEVSQ